MNKILIIFLIFIFSIKGESQNSEISFKKIAKGLPQSTISSFTQDENGFIWIGTHYGLFRYDGINYKSFHYDMSDSLSLRSNIVTCVLAVRDEIWIGTYGGGINILDLRTNEVRKLNYTSKDGFKDDKYITTLYLDENNIIWIGTEKGGIFTYDFTTDQYNHFFIPSHPISKTSFNSITSIDHDKNGNILIGTFGEGLTIIEKGTGNIINLINEDNNSLSLQNNVIRHLFGGKWIGTNKGLYLLDYKNGQYVFKDPVDKNDPLYNKLQQSVILSMAYKNDKLWIGSENNGLFSLNLSNNRLEVFENDPLFNNSIAGNSIWTLMVDKDDNLWIGTYLTGVNIVEPYSDKFTNLDKIKVDKEILPVRLINSMLSDDESNFWIASDGGGLFMLNNKKEIKRNYRNNNSNHFLNSNEVTTLLLDSEENLWVGTWSKGLSIKKKDSEHFSPFPLPSFLSNKANAGFQDIYYLFEDSRKRIWISTFFNGLILYEPKSGEFKKFNKDSDSQSIVSNKIRVITEDSDGNIWIGSEENGAQMIRLNSANEIIEEQKYFLNTNRDETDVCRINDILQDCQNNIWIATSGKGLFKIKDRQIIKQYTTEDGFPDNMISSIESGMCGTLWISTISSIFSFDYRKEWVESFSNDYGMLQGGYINSASYKSKDGRIYFGGVNGITSFDPSNIIRNTNIPEVFITQLSISNTDYSKLTKHPINIYNNEVLNLRHSQNDLSISFSAINYIQSDKNEYRYILENYDSDWRIPGANRQALYPNLLPGTYRFIVQASNNDGFWNREGAVLDIIIKKPWYKTYLAYSIYLTLFGLLIWWGRNITIKKEKLKSQLDLEHLELTKAQEINEIKSRFFTNVSHELKTPLTLIISPIKKLLSKSDIKDKERNSLIQVNKNANKLYQLINQILDISMIDTGNMGLTIQVGDISELVRQKAINFISLAEELSIDYKINIPSSSISLCFDSEKIDNLLENLLSNAFKFTPKHGKISINLEEYEEKVILTINNTGKGISPQNLNKIFDRYFKTDNSIHSSSTGIGLALVKEYVEMHFGQIIVESEENVLTKFKVLLFKGTEHFETQGIPIIDAKEENSNIFTPPIAKEKLEIIQSKSAIEEKIQILVAEDNADMREFIVQILSEKYKVYSAENGLQAYNLAQKIEPDILITDIMMPEMDGFELCSQIKSNALTSKAFTIMLSVKSSDEEIRKAYSYGVNNYLTKPFEPAHLELIIENMLTTRSYFNEMIKSDQVVSPEPSNIPAQHKEEMDTFFNDVMNILESQVSNVHFRVEDLGKELGMSKSKLYRLCKAIFGISGNEIIRSFRMKRAAQLLQKTNIRISEVTYKVGLNDLHSFRQNFKRQYGMSPSKYREQFRQELSILE